MEPAAAFESTVLVQLSDRYLALSRGGVLACLATPDARFLALEVARQVVVPLPVPDGLTVRADSLILDDEEMAVYAASSDELVLLRWPVPLPEDLEHPVATAVALTARFEWASRLPTVVEPQDLDEELPGWVSRSELGDDIEIWLDVDELRVVVAGELVSRTAPPESRNYLSIVANPHVLLDGDTLVIAVQESRGDEPNWLAVFSLRDLRERARLGRAAEDVPRRLFPVGRELTGMPEYDYRPLFKLPDARFPKRDRITGFGGNLAGDRIVVVGKRSVHLRTWPSFHAVTSLDHPDRWAAAEEVW